MRSLADLLYKISHQSQLIAMDIEKCDNYILVV